MEQTAPGGPIAEPRAKPATTTPAVPSTTASEHDDTVVRVYVWQAPVRIAHWLIVLSLIVLSFTGYYIHRPFIISRNSGAFTMGTVRFIHEVAGFVLISALLIRIYWFFVGNKYARWRAFIPITKAQWRGIGTMLKFYLFLRWRAPEEVGHNPLAAFVYLIVYLLIFVQIITGLALFTWVLHTSPWTTLFGWIPRWISIQYLREIHYFLMFIFMAFMIHHVYSAILVSMETKNGTMGSIFSGHKFVPAEVLEAEEAEAKALPELAPIPEPQALPAVITEETAQ